MYCGAGRVFTKSWRVINPPQVANPPHNFRRISEEWR